jgi:hypothetical protein
MRLRRVTALIALAAFVALPARAATPPALTRLESCLRAKRVYVTPFTAALAQPRYRMRIDGGFGFAFPFVFGSSADGGTAVLAHTAVGAADLERLWRRQAVDPGSVAYRRGLVVVVWRSSHPRTRALLDACLPAS